MWRHYQIDSIDFTKLVNKYAEENIVDEDLRLLVRNVRRRLYDALNVMISAGIVAKTSKNHLRLRLQRARVKQEHKPGC